MLEVQNIDSFDLETEQDSYVNPKYYAHRFSLFSLFAHGIKLDPESWYSCTPERIAIHISSRIPLSSTICDAFSGAGIPSPH
jgi:hypothetical protein